jgi:hypothetical protein
LLKVEGLFQSPFVLVQWGTASVLLGLASDPVNSFDRALGVPKWAAISLTREPLQFAPALRRQALLVSAEPL